MKKIPYLLTLFLFLSISCANQKSEKVPSIQDEVSLESSWEKVKELEQNGKQASAIKELNVILETAAQAQKYEDVFKALAIRSKYFQEIEEQAADKIINSFYQQIDLAESPGKELLQSALAELYIQYLQSNIWVIRDRTKRQDFDEKKVSLMSEEELKETASSLYDESISNWEVNGKIRINSLERIYNSKREDSSYLENFTVHDFLARRALDHFESEALQQNSFDYLEDEELLFERSSEFVNIDWHEQSTNKEISKWLTTYSSIIRRSIDSKNETAFHHFNLRRLKSSLRYSSLQNKNLLYRNVLNEEISSLKESHNRDELRSEIALNLFQENQFEPALQKCSQCEEETSFGNSKCKELKANIVQSSHRVQSELVYPSERSILFSYEYRNLKKAYFKVIQIEENEVWNEHYTKADLAKFLSQESIVNWKQDLYGFQDYKSHRTELMTQGLPSADYFLFASTRADFNIDSSNLSVVHFKVSDIAYLERKNLDGSNTYIFKDRFAGNSLVGAKVSLYTPEYGQFNSRNQWTKMTELISDENGEVNISTQERNNNLRLKIEFGEQNLIPNGRVYLFGNQSIDSKRILCDIFTDRSVYRPGQTIHFKGILYELEKGKEEIIKNGETFIRLFDSRGEELSKLELRTNNLGSFSGSFFIPKNVLNGSFRIANEFGSYSFRVEEYKRPSIRIVFDSSITTYKMGDTVCTNLSIESFTGIAVNHSQLDYKIIQHSLFFPEPRYSSYFPFQKGKIIQSGKVQLAENQYSICFPTKKLGRIGSSSYELIVNVNGPLGENIQEKKNFLIGEIPYQLKIVSKESLSTKELNDLYIKAENIYGKEVNVKGELNLWKLKTPQQLYINKYWSKVDHQILDENTYEKEFPAYSFRNNVELDELEIDHLVSTNSFETRKAINSFSMLNEGAYLIEAHAVNEEGDTIKVEKRIRLNDPTSKEMAWPEYFWTQLKEDSVEFGKALKLRLSSSVKGLPLLVEIEKDGKILSVKKVVLNNEKTWLELPTKNEIGRLTIHISGIALGRSVTKSLVATVVPKEKKYEIYLKKKRDYTQPGAEEKWTVGIKNLENEKNIEVLASMHDHSLDKIEKQKWRTHQKWERSSQLKWEGRNNFNIANSRNYQYHNRSSTINNRPNLPYLNWFGFYFRGSGFGVPYFSEAVMMTSAPDDEVIQDSKIKLEERDQINSNVILEEKENIRSDFRETVFFYPQLQNEGEDEIELSFEMPDALTEWKFRALAHDENLNFYQISHTLISKKDLMVKSYFPKFFRTADQSTIKIELTNNSNQQITGKLGLDFTDKETDKKVNVLLDANAEFFSLSAGESKIVSFKFQSPKEPLTLKYKLSAISDQFQDIELGYLAVLPSSILITESFPFEVKAGERTQFYYKNFAEKLDKVENNRSFKIEYSADPRWLAVFSLPSMLRENNDNPEMVFSNLYAQCLSKLTIEKVSTKNDLKSLLRELKVESELDRNEDIKYVPADASPWISVLKEERDQRAKLNDLFNNNAQTYSIAKYVKELEELQLENGAWPWFKGMKANAFITQYICGGLGKIIELEIVKDQKNVDQIQKMLSKAYDHLDRQTDEYFKRLTKNGIDEKEDYLSPNVIQYLYVRSFDQSWKPSAAASFFLQQSEQFWSRKNAFLKAKIGLIHLGLNKNNQLSQNILISLKDNAINDSLGIHWNFEQLGPYWYQSPIEAQAHIIELYRTVDPNDLDLQEMKKWLLHQKKQQYWKGNIATAEANYALLSDERELVSNLNNTSVFVGGEEISSSKEGIAYVNKLWNQSEINESQAHIEITQDKSSFGWGSAYWQYYENMESIGKHSKQGLEISTEYFIYEIIGKEEKLLPITSRELKVGDLIKQRTEIVVDYDLDFVFISDHPPANFQTINTKSGMQYKEGLGFYINWKDAEKQWYIDDLNKGRYVFESDYRISHRGEFSGGVSKLQCLYAPEFSAHSSAGSIVVK